MSKVEITNPDKVFWPKHGYTKGDLCNYYHSVAKLILPYLKDRPQSLLRQPNGVKDKGFFQKDVDHMPPDWVQTKKIYSKSNKANINYLLCQDEDHLLYLVQLGCIEINPWNSRIQNLDKPDWIVMDLDPEDIGFEAVIQTAQAIHKLFDKWNIPSFPKTSGKTGIHIYVPMGAKYTYDQAKQFAHMVAETVQQQLPDITSTLRMPKKRQGKVYIDFLQNRKGQTLAAPYSVRPTEDATVSTPLKWSEVTNKLDPTKFTIKTMSARLKKGGDLWKPVVGKGINLEKILKNIS